MERQRGRKERGGGGGKGEMKAVENREGKRRRERGEVNGKRGKANFERTQFDYELGRHRIISKGDLV